MGTPARNRGLSGRSTPYSMWPDRHPAREFRQEVAASSTSGQAPMSRSAVAPLGIPS